MPSTAFQSKRRPRATRAAAPHLPGAARGAAAGAKAAIGTPVKPLVMALGVCLAAGTVAGAATPAAPLPVARPIAALAPLEAPSALPRPPIDAAPHAALGARAATVRRAGKTLAAQAAGTAGAAAADGPRAGFDLGPTPEQVALVADRVTYDSTAGTLTAEGAVEVFYGTRTLTADRIVYDSETRRISAEGAIVLRDPTGTTVFASAAELDAELYDGIVRGAQSVIAAGVLDDGSAGATARLAAAEARRIEGRYNTLSRAVYSPCDVCEENPTPLWRIRARRVIHDEEERMIHYEDATFDVLGVPVAYLPVFSHPDPTVKRATGFLVPSVTDSGTYGLGVRVPFFWAIDPSTDVLFQPFITTDDGVVLDGEVRRAFETGDLRFRGSVVQTDYTGEARLQGHVDTDARFDLAPLGDTAEVGWDVLATTDDAYLRFFDITGTDRLTSNVFLRGYERDHYFDIEGVYFQSLRDDEPAGPIPTVLPLVDARMEFDEPLTGGRLGLFLNTQTLFRDVGTDTTRLSIGADWERELILSNGLAIRGFASLRGDLFLTFDDAGSSDFSDDTRERIVPRAGVEVRYPLISEDTATGVHVIEPLVRFEATPFGLNGERFPNEDSRQTEFDEMSLFDVDRFSGLDAVEEGPRFTLGLRYERLSEDGIFFSADGGRILRFSEADEFDAGSGLNGVRSDYVVGWRIGYDDIVSLKNRLRFDDDFTLSRNEVSLDIAYGPAELSFGYAFLESVPEAGAEDDRQEITSLAQVQLTQDWGIEGYVQRDLEENEFVEVGAGLSYANECCAIDLIAKRRFASSEDSPASTSVGFQVRLLTLGTGQRPAGLFGSGDIGRPGGGSRAE